MYISRKLAFNSLLLFAGNAFSSLLAFAVSVYLIRHLGPADFGRYSVVFAYLSFFHTLTGAGIDAILIREISIEPNRRDLLASQAIFLRLLMSLAAAAIAWLLLPYMGYDHGVRGWIHLASLGLLFNARTVFSALFQARMNVANYVMPELAVGLLFNALLFMAIYKSASISVLVALQTFNFFALAVVLFLSARHKMSFRLRFDIDRQVFRNLFVQSVPMIVTGLLIALMFRIDHLLIYWMLGSVPLGLYSSVVRVTEAFNLILSAYATVVYPVMCSAHATSPDYYRMVYRRSMKYMGSLIIPIAFGSTLLSKNILLLLYGEKFASASVAFAILMWATVFVFLGTIYGNALIAAGMQRYIMMYSAAGLVFNVVLNLLLIPKYGINGAAFATLNSYGGAAYLLQLLDRRIRPYALEYIRASALPVAASCGMVIFLGFLGNHWPIHFQIIAGMIFYLLALYLMRFFDPEDKEYLRQIFLS